MFRYGMENLIQQLIRNGTLHSEDIISAFRKTDRIDFVPEESKTVAHDDVPIHIGYQQTISQPSTVAFMLELLGVLHGEKVLDIGSGSGWTTALLAQIVGERGEVTGLERVEELVEFGKNNITKYKINKLLIIIKTFIDTE